MLLQNQCKLNLLMMLLFVKKKNIWLGIIKNTHKYYVVRM